MAGPIQTAIGQALGAAAGAVALGKKFNEDERQATEKAAAKREKEEKEQKAALQAAKDKRDADKALKEKHEAAIRKEEQKAAEAEEKAKQKAAQDEEKAKQEAALSKKEERLKRKADIQEAEDVATEADLINLGASPEAAKAYLLAQKRGIAAPKRMLFDKQGKAVATYDQMAEILADQSLADTYTSQLRTKNKIKVRRQLLEGKSHKERVESAVLAAGGKYHG